MALDQRKKELLLRAKSILERRKDQEEKETDENYAILIKVLFEEIESMIEEKVKEIIKKELNNK